LTPRWSSVCHFKLIVSIKTESQIVRKRLTYS
jgi:hypothetical protein